MFCGLMAFRRILHDDMRLMVQTTPGTSSTAGRTTKAPAPLSPIAYHHRHVHWFEKITARPILISEFAAWPERLVDIFTHSEAGGASQFCISIIRVPEPCSWYYGGFCPPRKPRSGPVPVAAWLLASGEPGAVSFSSSCLRPWLVSGQACLAPQ